MCAVEDCEPWAVYHDTKPVARREHVCEECARTITPGEQYLRIEGRNDGAWLTYKICRHCDALGSFMSEMCNGWPIGDLRSELVEHWREGYTSIPLGRLIACMHLKWHDGTDPVPSGMREVARSMMAGAVAA